MGKKVNMSFFKIGRTVMCMALSMIPDYSLRLGNGWAVISFKVLYSLHTLAYNPTVAPSYFWHMIFNPFPLTPHKVIWT